MQDEIRPGYYKQAGNLCKPVLRALGYDDRLLLAMECLEAWQELSHRLGKARMAP